jgi:hypothetical protein
MHKNYAHLKNCNGSENFDSFIYNVILESNDVRLKSLTWHWKNIFKQCKIKC